MLPTLNNRLTNNTLLAVTLEEAARQCRLTTDDLKDTDLKGSLTGAIYAAQAYLEANYSVVFGLNDFKSIYILDNTDFLHFSISNVAEVKSVTLLENTSTLAYEFYKSNSHSFLDLSKTQSGKVAVEYSAGFATSEAIPYNVKQAILMLTSYYFDNRNAATEKSSVPSAFAVDALMLLYKKLY